MSAYRYVTERQKLWALRQGRPIDGQAYTLRLAGNLFRPLVPGSPAWEEIAAGAGNELGIGRARGRMQAVHSSSAAAVNVFHYWRELGQVSVIASALGHGGVGPQPDLRFEQTYPIHGIPPQRTCPHLDVEMRAGSGRPVAVEVKLREPYGRHRGLNGAYLRARHAGLWEGLPGLRALAGELSPDNSRFTHLHAAQLLTHVLGLRSQHPQGFSLVYLWCAVPCKESSRHAREIHEFAEIAMVDRIDFRAVTYQELILRLASEQRSAHQAYVDYLVDRYL